MRPRLLIGATLLVAAFLLVPPIRTQARVVRSVLKNSYHSLTASTFEERRLAFYGDCDKHGYGYATRMVSRFPDARKAPRIRNPSWDPRIVPVVLPGFRWVVDDRVMVAIGLTQADAQESRMPAAERRGTDSQGTEEWTLTTGEEFEILSGMTLAWPDASSAEATTVKLALLVAIGVPDVVGAWEFRVPSGQAHFEFRLPRPVLQFSVARPTLPFLLKVHTQDRRPLASITPWGVKIDMREYVVVNHEGSCFTAVTRALLEALTRADHLSWSEYVATIRNVRRD